MDSVKLKVLEEAVEDPDTVSEKIAEKAVRSLEICLLRSLAIRVWSRSECFWVDTPPPERDLELGIDRYCAWQTQLHREAVRRTLEHARRSTRSPGGGTVRSAGEDASSW